MTAGPFVTVERGLGPNRRIGLVRFDRGNRINALSPAAMRELRAAAESFEDDTSTSVVVLTGRADAFSAGFDLGDAEGIARGGLDLDAKRVALRAGPRMCRAWYEMEQVTIAAIEGHCIGGGVALAVSLDFRISAVGGHFRIPEVELGMNMSWGSLPRLVQLIGPARTKQAVILAADRISPVDALAWGLVEQVVDDGQTLVAAMAMAERIAHLPPLGVTMTKATVNRIAGALDDAIVHMDSDQFALTTSNGIRRRP